MSRFDTPTWARPSLILVALALLTLFAWTPAARAQKGGGHSLGINLALANAEQEHMNTLIQRANTREGGITTSALNQAYEASVHYGYRFSGSMIAILFRPSFVYQRSTGSGASGGFNYGVTGFTFFPMMRLYPLENNFMKFFMQFGLGYGRANSTIEEASAKVEMAGDAFGTLLGMGTEFCFKDTHCAIVEANYRYLLMERNIATSSQGTFTPGSLTRSGKDQEVEMDDTDLAVRMSGLQFMLGYAFRF